MKNFRGRDSRKRDFGRRGSGGRSQMHEAVCAECGEICEVPFKPTGDKPVYCSVCFSERQGGDRRSEGRDFGRKKIRDRDRDRKMYTVICDKCGKSCQVPFQPTPGKPVYCDECFGKSGSGPAQKNDQLATINSKLDKIINALITAKIIKPEMAPAPAKAKPNKEKEVKKAEVKKEVKPAKKTKPAKNAKPAKKVAAKKPVKKKKK